MKQQQSNPIMEPRKIQVFSETLSIFTDGTVYISYGIAGDKLVCELDDVETKTDEELKEELETILWYDYQDNKE